MSGQPNYRDGECCYTCKYGENDIRCGCHVGFYCNKYKDDSISETGKCDDYFPNHCFNVAIREG